LYCDFLVEQEMTANLLSDYSVRMNMSDDEYSSLLDEIEKLGSLNFNKIWDYLETKCPELAELVMEESLISEDTPQDILINKRFSEKGKRLLGGQFYAKKSDADEKRLQATANRLANFKWDKRVLRWVRREKPGDVTKIRQSLIKRRVKWKLYSGKKYSERASMRRQREKEKMDAVGKKISRQRREKRERLGN
jgi:hypothetical protein